MESSKKSKIIVSPIELCFSCNFSKIASFWGKVKDLSSVFLSISAIKLL